MFVSIHANSYDKDKGLPHSRLNKQTGAAAPSVYRTNKGQDGMTNMANKTDMTKENLRTIRKEAFIKTIPIMCSYFFIGTAYGMMMENAGFAWYYSLLASAAVYTGAFQFLLITLLSSGASIITITLAALLMNSRHTFYSISFIDEFRSMGKRKLFMIRTMTDETYALNCSVPKDAPNRGELLYRIALYSRCYWIFASAAGGIIGQLIPYDLTGIDFCMTALFVILFINQWEEAKDHRPALLGLVVALVCLFVFGSGSFMLPALLITSALLILLIKQDERKEERRIEQKEEKNAEEKEAERK